MNESQNRQELHAAIEGDRYRILELLAAHETLSSSEIRDRATIPQGSKHYQLSLLESWGLIEQVDTVYRGEHETGVPASVYALTANGRALVQEFDETMHS